MIFGRAGKDSFLETTIIQDFSNLLSECQEAKSPLGIGSFNWKIISDINGQRNILDTYIHYCVELFE
jgi:hypothetical protein